jgi:hypothetical protein
VELEKRKRVGMIQEALGLTEIHKVWYGKTEADKGLSLDS